MTATATTSRWIEIRGQCPACGHKGWCGKTEDGSVIKCRRNSAGRPVKHQDAHGPAWLFLASQIAGGIAPSKARKEQPRLKSPEVAAILKQNKTALSPQRLERLSTQLGLRKASLQAFGVGWDAEHGAYSFPMYDGQQKPCGIHLRTTEGDKFCRPGSRLGLFIADDFELFSIPDAMVEGDDVSPLLLLMPEGVSDACAARDMGYRAIGRPSNAGGADMLVELLADKPAQELVVVADRDDAKYLPDGTPRWPGIEGAVGLCERLMGISIDVASDIAQAKRMVREASVATEPMHAKILPIGYAGRKWFTVIRRYRKPVTEKLQFMMPPEGVKDLRAWLGSGKGGDAVTKVANEQLLALWRVRLDERKSKERKPGAA